MFTVHCHSDTNNVISLEISITLVILLIFFHTYGLYMCLSAYWNQYWRVMERKKYGIQLYIIILLVYMIRNKLESFANCVWYATCDLFSVWIATAIVRLARPSMVEPDFAHCRWRSVRPSCSRARLFHSIFLARSALARLHKVIALLIILCVYLRISSPHFLFFSFEHTRNS